MSMKEDILFFNFQSEFVLCVFPASLHWLELSSIMLNQNSRRGHIFIVPGLLGMDLVFHMKHGASW